MATWGDVSRFALALPEAVESDMRGQRAWKVKDKLFVWERPLRKSDLAALGDAAPDGPILGARVEHYEIAAYEALVEQARALGEKDVQALLERNLKEERARLSDAGKHVRRLNEAAAELES